MAPFIVNDATFRESNEGTEVRAVTKIIMNTSSIETAYRALTVEFGGLSLLLKDGSS